MYIGLGIICMIIGLLFLASWSNDRKSANKSIINGDNNTSVQVMYKEVILDEHLTRVPEHLLEEEPAQPAMQGDVARRHENTKEIPSSSNMALVMVRQHFQAMLDHKGQNTALGKMLSFESPFSLNTADRTSAKVHALRHGTKHTLKVLLEIDGYGKQYYPVSHLSIQGLKFIETVLSHQGLSPWTETTEKDVTK